MSTQGYYTTIHHTDDTILVRRNSDNTFIFISLTPKSFEVNKVMFHKYENIYKHVDKKCIIL